MKKKFLTTETWQYILTIWGIHELVLYIILREVVLTIILLDKAPEEHSPEIGGWERESWGFSDGFCIIISFSILFILYIEKPMFMN